MRERRHEPHARMYASMHADANPRPKKRARAHSRVRASLRHWQTQAHACVHIHTLCYTQARACMHVHGTQARALSPSREINDMGRSATSSQPPPPPPPPPPLSVPSPRSRHYRCYSPPQQQQQQQQPLLRQHEWNRPRLPPSKWSNGSLKHLIPNARAQIKSRTYGALGHRPGPRPGVVQAMNTLVGPSGRIGP